MKVNIITVTKNSARTIKDTLQSVLNQTYSNVHHYIIDGVSTDKTIDIVKEFIPKYRMIGKDLTIVSEPDEGIYDAINKGIRLAKSGVVAILNSDDLYYDANILFDIIHKFDNTSIDALYGNLSVYDDTTTKVKRIIKSKQFKPIYFYQSWVPPHPTFFCRLSIYLKLGLYKTNYKIASDGELMLRYMLIHKINTIYFDRFIVKMRIGGVSSNGIKSTIKIIKETQQAFYENGLRLNLVYYLFHKFLKIKEFL